MHKKLIAAFMCLLALPCAALAATATPAASGGQALFVSRTLTDSIGTQANPTIYNIDGTTYFKLRDLGHLLDFGVTFDEKRGLVRIEPDASYVPLPTETGDIKNTATQAVQAEPSKQTVYVNDTRVTPTVFNIKGNNYFAIRDLGELIDFCVAYDYDSRRITAYRAYPYAAQTQWNAAMNDLAGNLAVSPASSYAATAARYASVVSGEANADWRMLISTLRAVKDAPPYAESPSHISRANLYWANRLAEQLAGAASAKTPDYASSLPSLAAGALWGNPDKADLQSDFTALCTAYLRGAWQSAATAKVINSLSKDARDRLMLPESYAAAHSVTDAEITAAKQLLSDDMLQLSLLPTDDERVARIMQLLGSRFETGGDAFWTTALQTGEAIDINAYAAAADWMLREAGVPAFIARSYGKAWNVVYVNQAWSVFDGYGGTAALRSLTDYLPDDTNPASTLLMTQVMRPGAAYLGADDDLLSKYFTYTELTGASAATAAQMQAYLRAVNPTVAQSVLDMIPLYLSEGQAEGIRGDIAFAQSCLETGNFTFTGSAVTLEQNNFCGLGVVQNGVTGAIFETPQLGIRAQIQHLKAYANTEPLQNECVDPRFSLVSRGNAPTVQYLGIQENPKKYGWASGMHYGTKIMNILNYILSYPRA